MPFLLLLLGMLLLPQSALADARCALRAGEQTFPVRVAQGERSLAVYVPPAVRRRQPLPLIINLHGSSGNGATQALTTGVNAVAARKAFLTAHPDGGITLPSAPNAHYWNIPGVPLTVGATPADAADDVAFIAALIDQLVATGCVDAARVYVTGMSGGARMTSLLGCRLSSKIAAIAPVAGLRAGLPSANDPSAPDPASCAPERTLPIVTFHGTGDPVNPYDGGGPPYWSYGVERALQRWVEINGCNAAPREQRISAHVTRVRYTRCTARAEIVLYRIDATAAEGGGHVWPDASVMADDPRARSSPPTREISASEAMWEFLRHHRRQ